MTIQFRSARFARSPFRFFTRRYGGRCPTRLIEDPYEIWVGFARSEVSGRVGVRKKYVKLLRVEKDRVLGMYAETRNGLWVGEGFFRGSVTALKNLRKGRLLYGRE